MRLTSRVEITVEFAEYKVEIQVLLTTEVSLEQGEIWLQASSNETNHTRPKTHTENTDPRRIVLTNWTRTLYVLLLQPDVMLGPDPNLLLLLWLLIFWIYLIHPDVMPLLGASALVIYLLLGWDMTHVNTAMILTSPKHFMPKCLLLQKIISPVPHSVVPKNCCCKS